MRLSASTFSGRCLVAVLVVAVGVQTGSACSDGEGSAEGRMTGAELYERSCASCHGGDLRGTDIGPSHLSEVYAPDHHPDASFRAAIEQGSAAHHWSFGDMPPVPGLSDDEVDRVIAYIREQQETHGLDPYPPE